MQIHLVRYGARDAVDVFHAAREPFLVAQHEDYDLRDPQGRNREIIRAQPEGDLAHRPSGNRGKHHANGPREQHWQAKPAEIARARGVDRLNRGNGRVQHCAICEEADDQPEHQRHRHLAARHPAFDLHRQCNHQRRQREGAEVQKVVVSEAGASVYSASEFAAKEFPGLDVSLRGAVSIARRLQDPLAELVKIDPKSIGVGQYQHDVSQLKLARGLDAVVEDCVNAVGVDVNTASVALLARISGLNATLAQNIVTHRDENGAFKTRAALKKVARLGEKTFEQAAGFLRVMNGDNPLDSSAVHPEAYPLVQRIAAETDRDIRSLIGDSGFLKRLDPKKFTDETFGLPTVTDILQELDKPGRDPRPEFKTAEFQEGVEDLKDLQLGMILEGVVTNVTNFGAFVDIGVHQDGLVHVSALSNTFVKDPHSVVKTGQIVKVKVLEVDIPRKRISLTMKMGDEVPRGAGGKSAGASTVSNRSSGGQRKPESNSAGFGNSAFAAAFAKAKQNS